MFLKDVPFGLTDWSQISTSEHSGIQGKAIWRTKLFGNLRVRMVEYSAGYIADHWCEKGHILLCLEGSIETELKDGRKFILRPGISYQVGDLLDEHRSSSPNGAKLFIIDGENNFE